MGGGRRLVVVLLGVSVSVASCSKQSVTAANPAAEPAVAAERVEVPDAPVPGLGQLGRARVEGRMLRNPGWPVGGHQISIYARSLVGSQRTAPVETDEDGRFELVAPSPAVVHLGLNAGVLHQPILIHGDQAHVDLRMTQIYRVEPADPVPAQTVLERAFGIRTDWLATHRPPNDAGQAWLEHHRRATTDEVRDVLATELASTEDDLSRTVLLLELFSLPSSARDLGTAAPEPALALELLERVGDTHSWWFSHGDAPWNTLLEAGVPVEEREERVAAICEADPVYCANAEYDRWIDAWNRGDLEEAHRRYTTLHEDHHGTLPMLHAWRSGFVPEEIHRPG